MKQKLDGNLILAFLQDKGLSRNAYFPHPTEKNAVVKFSKYCAKTYKKRRGHFS